MNENHKIVDQMMQYCGFRDGAGWANNLLIDTALKNGALGAKLTGAGSGGSVFALTQPGQEKQILRAWKKNIREVNLSNALVYYPKISRRGLAIIQRN
jgi:galactokinase